MSVGLLVVGSPAVVTDPNHGPRRVVVERVGRKYLYIKGQRDGFDRESGVIKNDWGNAKLWTLDEYNHHCAVENAWLDLFKFGIRVDRTLGAAVLLEIRKALLHIVPPATEPSSKVSGSNDG